MSDVARTLFSPFLLLLLAGLMVAEPASAQWPCRARSDIPSPEPGEVDNFGAVLASQGPLVAIGDRHRVHLRDTGTQSILRSFEDPDPRAANGFGHNGLALGPDFVVVGAPNQTVAGHRYSGIAYVFDLETGELRMQIHNPTPEENDLFGRFALAPPGTGGRIYISAPGDREPFRRQGAVYAFDAETGELLATYRNPLPSSVASPGEYTEFGAALAHLPSATHTIGGRSALLVGDPRGGSAIPAGALHLFDPLAEGEVLEARATLEAPAGAEDFGRAVAVGQGRIYVGAPKDDQAGDDSGAVYIYSRYTLEVKNIVRARRPTPGSEFGDALALDAHLAVRAGWSDHDRKTFVDLYSADGCFIRHLRGPDDVGFGAALAWGSREGSPPLLFMGTPGFSDTEVAQGLVKRFEAGCEDRFCANRCTLDTDADGLPDDWEIFGLDVDGDGLVDVDLPALGADPMRKDLFLEIDYMVGDDHTHNPGSRIIDRLEEVFAQAPLTNPDGSTGISLHVDLDEEIPHHEVIDFNPNGNEGNDFVDFYDVKEDHFDADRAQVYRYMVSAHSHSGVGNTSSGLAEIHGNDAIVSLVFHEAELSDNHTVLRVGGTILHEFGHNLGLGHTGGGGVNLKPNYLSVMNYRYQLVGIPKSGGFPVLDYSRFTASRLDERRLNEALGLYTGTDGRLVSYHCEGTDQQATGGGRFIDWNCDGEIPIRGVVEADISGNGSLDVMAPWDDWQRIQLGFHCFGSFADGPNAHWVDPEEKPSLEELEEWGVAEAIVRVQASAAPRCPLDPASSCAPPQVTVTAPGTEVFEAEDVEDSSLRFADASPVEVRREDTDGDGRLDLVSRYRTSDLGFSVDSTQGHLFGSLATGTKFHGVASIRGVDPDPPTLSEIPDDATVECDAVPPPAEVTAEDACDPTPGVELEETRRDGVCPGNYTLVRAWTARDACENATTGSQVLSVRDTTPPTVTGGDEVLGCLWPPNHSYHCFSTEDFPREARESCSEPLTWAFTDCSAVGPGADDEGFDTADDCLVDRDGSRICVRAERPGSVAEGRRYRVEMTATDACGNPSDATVVGYLHVPHDSSGARGCGGS